MPDIPRLDSCCCGLVPLRTGTIIVGIVCLILTLGLSGPMAWSLGGIMLYVEVVLLVCCIVSSVLLIIGVIQDTPKYVKFFVIVWLLDMLYVIVMLIFIFLGHNYSSHDVLRATMSTAVFVCVVGYCVCVANSYFSSLTGESAIQTA